MEKAKSSNIVQMVLIALLVGAAFYIGSLSSKVDRLEQLDKGTAGAGTETETASTFDAVALAKSLGINEKAFKACFDGNEVESRLTDEETSGANAGIQGTPGIIMYDTQTQNSAVIPGAVDITTMQLFLDNLLAGKPTTLGTQEMKLQKIADLKLLSDEDYVRGDRSARVVLFEYSDYDCPFCKRVHPTLVTLLENNPGEVAWVYRQFPLIQLHPEARIKSAAALCAGKVGGNDAFWAYSDALAK